MVERFKNFVIELSSVTVENQLMTILPVRDNSNSMLDPNKIALFADALTTKGFNWQNIFLYSTESTLKYPYIWELAQYLEARFPESSFKVHFYSSPVFLTDNFMAFLGSATASTYVLCIPILFYDADSYLRITGRNDWSEYLTKLRAVLGRQSSKFTVSFYIPTIWMAESVKTLDFLKKEVAALLGEITYLSTKTEESVSLDSYNIVFKPYYNIGQSKVLLYDSEIPMDLTKKCEIANSAVKLYSDGTFSICHNNPNNYPILNINTAYSLDVLDNAEFEGKAIQAFNLGLCSECSSCIAHKAYYF